MKVALFGFGYWGKIIHSVLKKRGLEILVVDKNQKSKDISYSTKENVLSNEEVKHCFIVTPEETHFSLAKDCLSAGKNVFVEKPLSLLAEEAEELIEISKSKNLHLAVDQVFLYDPSLLLIKKLVKKFNLSSPTKVFSKRWSSLANKKKIHIIQDLLPHDLYIFEFLDLLDCSILNKSDINKNIEKQVFSKERTIFSLADKNTKFKFDYDWYSDQVEREMEIFFGDDKKIIWLKDKGFDQVSFFDKNKKFFDKKVTSLEPSPLDLLINDFFEKKTELSLEKTLDQIRVMNSLLS